MYQRNCKFCGISFATENKRIYCNGICAQKYAQHSRKNKDHKRYKLYLERQNKKRRDKVRKRRGLPLDTPSLTPQNGKGWKMKDGYKQLLLKDHPNSAKNGYIMEHVVVMSNHLGRPLRKGETIHHKNGIRNDNRLENLEIWVNTIRFGQRLEDKIKWCIDFLEIYGYVINKS